MKNKKRNSLYLLLVVSVLGIPFCVTSCSSDSSGSSSEVVVDNITGIEVTKEPDKISYYVGDSVNFDGIEINAIYQSGKREVIDIEDCVVIGATTISKGDQKITIQYEGFSTSFMIFIEEKSTTKKLSSVDIDALPNKTNYLPGEEFDASGMIVTARYSDGSILDVSSLVNVEMTESGGKETADMSHVGVKDVKVKYDGKFDTFNIFVRESKGYSDSDFGDNAEGQAFKNSVDSIFSNHNYVASVYSYIEYHQDEAYSSTFYNLNNKAYYNSDEESGLYGGLVYQKDQGFVIFRQAILTGNILTSGFYTTSTTHMISDIYDVVIENVLNAMWIQDSEDYSTFTTTDYYAIATGCNFTGYSSSANLEAPEKIIAKYVDANNIQIIVNFSVLYWDSGEMVREPGVCTIDVNVGGAVNQKLSEYISNPTYQYIAPTKWSESDQLYFEEYYGIIPPFNSGASYSFEFSLDNDYRGNYLYVLDYASGDIREDYRIALKEANYVQVGNDNNHFRYVTEKGLRITNYDVYLRYRLPTESYNGKTYGYYYPNGELYIEFIKTETNAVNTVNRYNKFVQDFVGEGVLPTVPFGDEVTSVTNFVYSTNTVDYKFYQSDFTRFYIASYETALSDMNEFIAALVQYGYTSVVYNKIMQVYNYSKPGKNSYVSISALDQIGESSYSGHLEIRCQLYASEY